MRASIVTAVLLLATACGGGSSSPSGFDDGKGTGNPANGGNPSDTGDAGSGGPVLGGGPVGDPGKGAACTKMDILFVVDDSGSMEQEQTNLVANFPRFVGVMDSLASKAGGAIDYRVAVTTTGKTMTYNVQLPPIGGISLPPTKMDQKGDDGRFRKNCPGMTRPWIEKGDANRTTAFECAATVGTKGPSMEMPLETMHLALKDRIADKSNGDFLREDALLAVVLLTDEDDCSRTDNNFTVTTPQEVCAKAGDPLGYTSFLDGLKGKGRWATAVIAGPGPGACTSSFGEAQEATRLKAFASSAGKTGKFSSICAGDLTTALDDAMKTFDAACQDFPPR